MQTSYGYACHHLFLTIWRIVQKPNCLSKISWDGKIFSECHAGKFSNNQISDKHGKKLVNYISSV